MRTIALAMLHTAAPYSGTAFEIEKGKHTYCCASRVASCRKRHKFRVQSCIDDKDTPVKRQLNID